MAIQLDDEGKRVCGTCNFEKVWIFSGKRKNQGGKIFVDEKIVAGIASDAQNASIMI